MGWRRVFFLLAVAFIAGCAGRSGSFIGSPGVTLTPPGTHANYTIYAFQNTAGEFGLPVSPALDGAQPKGTLTLVSIAGVPAIYGRTATGGNATTCGVFFRINPSQASSYSVIYRFSGADGCDPRHDAMVNDNGVLYSTTQGVTNSGTAINDGDIVALTPGTDVISVRHQFAGAPSDGSQQHSSFSFDGAGNAFGMSAKGGANDKGLLYYVPAGGTTPVGLHSFSKKDGDEPHGRVVLVGNTLWGITRKGGDNDLGVVFSLAVPSPLPASGVELPITVAHQFAGYGKDGAFSDHGYLTPVTQGGSTVLYGMTNCGGTGDGGDRSSCKGTGDGDGVVFQIDPATGAYSTFYQFQGRDSGDGADPFGSLLYDPATNLLYGTTRNGGKSDEGTVFAIAPGAFGSQGSIAWRYHFTGSNGDGANPIDNVILENGVLYGMTQLGGASSKAGTIFAIPLP